ncbi:UNVERIFIED_CONTAM: putative cyclic nucleotide-gated ion channel 13 [Sesamum radiatum]|uniref:Cyclic nucleotide-gated ion channel 13 n=1 Tax=Sesamum radiatum TaxID=300843 RepID=A0AAW2N9Q1_SESRA
MNPNEKKYVRFEDHNSESSFTSEGQLNCRLFPWRKPSFSRIVGGIKGEFVKESVSFRGRKLQITACVLRSSIDVLYIFHIVLQFRTGVRDPSSGVFGKGELIKDPKAIAKWYLSYYFIVDILSVLPLP